MTNRTELEAELRQAIVSNFLADGMSLQVETDLLGVLDSLQLLRLVVQIEANYGIKIEDGELTPDNLGTVKRMAAFLEHKRDQTPAATGAIRGAD